MKKILFLAMVAAALVGCSQNEEFENAGQKAEIKFQSVIKAGTKAAAITDLTGTAGFKVSAYNTGATESGAVLETPFINDEIVSYKDAKWNIAGGPYYWPMDANVQFFGYLNVANATYSLDANAKYPKVAYTIAAAAADQEDFVVAKLEGQKKADGAITLPFTHALTQVNFSVKAGNTALTYKVSDIKISGLYGKGTYSFETNTWDITGNTADASYTYPVLENVIVGTDPDNAEADATAVKSLTKTDGALMLMPQAMTAATNITISYEVYNGSTKIDAITNSKIELNGKTDWAAGTNIRYTLTLTSEGATIDFNPSVNPWADETPVPVPNETPTV